MWDLEETTGYSMPDIKEAFINAFSDLPEGTYNIERELCPGTIFCEYKAAGLYYGFVIDFVRMYSLDANIAVNKKRVGYGRSLVNAREKLCKTLGIESIVLSQVLPGSQGFWDNMGYDKGYKRL